MSRFSRRRFLEDSMLATTAALMASSAPTVLADEKDESTSPNEKLSVAIIGVNGRGNSHIGAFAGRKDTEVTYVCDADEHVGQVRAKQVAERQGREPKFVQDMREVMDDPSVDVVTIATPNHWHALAAIWAIQSGKDVYVEKPVSHNVSEGRRIVEAARKYNRICQTGTQSRSNPGMRQAIEYLHSGKLGDVTLGRGLCYKRRRSIGPRDNYTVPQSINYDLWLGPAPYAPLTRRSLHYDWHWQWPYGNGDLGNQGIHQMDICRWGLGVDNLGQGVVSYGGRLAYEDAGDTANTQVSIHDYGDKTLVFEVRGLETDDYKGAKVGNIFQGSDGYLVLTSYSGGAAFDPEGNVIEKFSGGADHFGNFLDAVRSRHIEDLNADILQGHLSSALCHLGNTSYRLGSPVHKEEAAERIAKTALGQKDENAMTFERFSEHLTNNSVDITKTEFTFGEELALDDSTESFIGNDKANQMLTREYREGFKVPAAGQV